MQGGSPPPPPPPAAAEPPTTAASPIILNEGGWRLHPCHHIHTGSHSICQDLDAAQSSPVQSDRSKPDRWDFPRFSGVSEFKSFAQFLYLVA